MLQYWNKHVNVFPTHFQALFNWPIFVCSLSITLGLPKTFWKLLTITGMVRCRSWSHWAKKTTLHKTAKHVIATAYHRLCTITDLPFCQSYSHCQRAGCTACLQWRWLSTEARSSAWCSTGSRCRSVTRPQRRAAVKQTWPSSHPPCCSSYCPPQWQQHRHAPATDVDLVPRSTDTLQRHTF